MWLAISIFGYALNSIAIVIDKILLRRAISHPVVYTFSISLLGGLVLVALPFVPHIPSTPFIGVGLLAGIVFALALWSFFVALARGEASRVAPLVGGLTPIAVWLSARPLLGEQFTLLQLVAFAALVVGGVLVGSAVEKNRWNFSGPTLLFGTTAAVLFGISHALSAYVYASESFVSGLVLRSIGGLVVAGTFLLWPTTRRLITTTIDHQKPANTTLFVVGQICGAASFLIVNYAFTLGSVTLVNALAGTQYLMLFVVALFLSAYAPHLLREKISRPIIIEKTVALLFVAGGLTLLAFAS